MRNLWFVRTKPLEQDEYGLCIKEQRIRFKWPLIGDLTNLDNQSIKALIHSLDLTQGDKKYKITEHLRIFKDIKIDDYILIIGQKEYTIGIITSNYAFDKISNRHYRKFQPLISLDISVPYTGSRSNLPIAVLESLGSQRTTMLMNKHKSILNLK